MLIIQWVWYYASEATTYAIIVFLQKISKKSIYGGLTTENINQLTDLLESLESNEKNDRILKWEIGHFIRNEKKSSQDAGRAEALKKLELFL